VISEGTIGADIVFLQTALNWAVEQGLLSHNPVARFKRPKNPRPKRPVADYDRYLRVQAVADRVDPRLGVFMTLIEALGWRESAICQLRAEGRASHSGCGRPVRAHSQGWHGRQEAR